MCLPDHFDIHGRDQKHIGGIRCFQLHEAVVASDHLFDDRRLTPVLLELRRFGQKGDQLWSSFLHINRQMDRPSSSKSFMKVTKLMPYMFSLVFGWAWNPPTDSKRGLPAGRTGYRGGPHRMPQATRQRRSLYSASTSSRS